MSTLALWLSLVFGVWIPGSHSGGDVVAMTDGTPLPPRQIVLPLPPVVVPMTDGAPFLPCP